MAYSHGLPHGPLQRVSSWHDHWLAPEWVINREQNGCCHFRRHTQAFHKYPINDTGQPYLVWEGPIWGNEYQEVRTTEGHLRGQPPQLSLNVWGRHEARQKSPLWTPFKKCFAAQAGIKQFRALTLCTNVGTWKPYFTDEKHFPRSIVAKNCLIFVHPDPYCCHSLKF